MADQSRQLAMAPLIDRIMIEIQKRCEMQYLDLFTYIPTDSCEYIGMIFKQSGYKFYENVFDPTTSNGLREVKIDWSKATTNEITKTSELTKIAQQSIDLCTQEELMEFVNGQTLPPHD